MYGNKSIESEGYYLFFNIEYNPKNITEFIKAFGIDKETKVLYTDFYVYNQECCISYAEVSNQYIFENILSKAGDNTRSFSYTGDEITGISIVLSIRSLGEKMQINILDNGDVYVEGASLVYSFIFSGGEEGVLRAVDFVNYINDNYKGKIRYYEN